MEKLTEDCIGSKSGLDNNTHSNYLDAQQQYVATSQGCVQFPTTSQYAMYGAGSSEFDGKYLNSIYKFFSEQEFVFCQSNLGSDSSGHLKLISIHFYLDKF